MRLKITLYSEKPFQIPINYNHPVSSAIYKMLAESSPEYAQWLHDRGFVTSSGKPMKLFTFSRFLLNNPKTRGNILGGRGEVSFLFSSIGDEQISRHLVQGILSAQTIRIGNRIAGGTFSISSVESIPPPEFSDAEQFRTLSPASISTVRESGGVKSIYYYRAEDDGTEAALEKNLLNKYELVRGKPYPGELRIRLDREYLRRRKGRASKLITIKEGRDDEVKVKAFLCPLEIAGSPDIIKLAYECGIGERSSQGFGMLEKI